MVSQSNDRIGALISVEGIDGSGKGSVLPAIRSCLEAHGIEVICTREPGGTALGESVRDILLSREAMAVSDEAELLLFFAARAQLVREVIGPALARGAWVLCDRFIDSTYAYQGSARGVARAHIEQLEAIATGGLRPGLTILLDLPVDVARGRVGARAPTDRLEGETSTFFGRVRAGYLKQSAAEPERIRVLDASKPLEDVVQQALREIDRLLQSR